MIGKLLKMAHDSGNDIVVCLKNSGDSFRGKIQDLDRGFFTLFQSNSSGGILWAFSKDDVESCGLTVNLPGTREQEAVESEEESSSRRKDQ